ncbi:hypothetical protein [Natrinema sp. HArc-T2]|uniref:hypothetical protein n=1 Tax=Natrinema sp. HArc-T2 TaxID=3242701 RepID=UPI00359D9C12
MNWAEVNLSDSWVEKDGRYVLSHQPSSIHFNATEDVTESIARNRGFYAVVDINDDRIVASVDHVRSIPLFYAVTSNGVYISDSAEWIEGKVGTRRSEITEVEFELAGFVSGPDTRNPDVKQLLPGELIEIREDGARTQKHFTFEYSTSDAQSGTSLRDVTQQSIRRLTRYADSRQIVIPLSAGLDSRLIATELVDAGYENVLCFTYGREGATHVTVAQEVASALDLDWIHVPYTGERWREWYTSDRKQDFFNYENTLASIPHVEAGPALSYLQQNGLIDDNCVICPGHSGDMVAGSHIPDSLFANRYGSLAQVVDEVIDHHYGFATMSDEYKNRLRTRVSTNLGIAGQLDCKTAIEAYESWDFRNRQAKFIINSIRSFESEGYDWYLPLWDREFAEFWLTVPLKQRYDKTKYRSYVYDRCSEVGDFSNITENTTERTTIWNRMKEVAKETPVSTAILPLYNKAKQQIIYGRHPLAWYEMLPRNEFDRYYVPWGGINPFVINDIQDEFRIQ